MPSTTKRRRWAMLRVVAVVMALLLVPLATLAVWGELGAAWIADWETNRPPPEWIAAALVGLLAADILLPVPSGPLITLAASQLGYLSAFFWSWTGLNLGAIAAFAAARWGGKRTAARLARSEDLQALNSMANRNLPLLILITRPLPMLAEVTVLVLGLLGGNWRAFLYSVVLANALVAASFTLLGVYAAENDLIISAVAFSVAVPLALAWWVRQRWLATA